MSLVMDKYDIMEEEQSLKYFSFTFGLSQFFGGLSVILMAIWMGKDGGFGWTEAPDQQFHYHPLFMTIGMIFLYGEAILVYRVFRHERKRFTKLLHGILHAMIFVFFVVALKAVFSSHNLKGDNNMYTLHSWLGIVTVVMFCLQFVCGFVCFFFPGLTYPVRSWYLPVHQTFGLLIFGLAVAAALMGISERAAWHVGCWKDGFHCGKGLLVNFSGLSILMYGLLVGFLVANPRYRRRSLPEEESLHQLTAD